MTHGSPIVLPRLFDEEVTREYIDQLVRALERSLLEIDSIKGLVGSTLQITDIPLTGNQQRDGAVFSDDGTLKIVLSNTGYAPSLVITSSIGSVTVTTS